MLEKTSIIVYCPDKYHMSETHHSQCIFIFKGKEYWYIYFFLTEIVKYQTTISQIKVCTKVIKDKCVLHIFLFNVKIIMIKNQICLTKNSGLLVIFEDHLVIFTTSSRKGEC